MGNCGFRIRDVGVENVRRSTVGHELSVDWEIYILNRSICAKYLPEVIRIDVFSKLFYNNLGAFWNRRTSTPAAGVASISIPFFRSSTITIPTP